MRVLFLAHLFPLPLDSGGKIKSFYTLRALASRHDVHLLAYVRTEQERSLVPQLQQTCSQVTTVPLARGKAAMPRDLALSLIGGRSFIVARDFRRTMQEAVESAIAEFKPDVIHIDHLQMAQFVDFSGGYRTVLDHHNVESMIIKRISETSDGRLMRLYGRIEWPKLQRYELEVCRRSDLVLTVSEEDRNTLVGLDPALENVECVPIGVDTERYARVERKAGSRNVLSIGTMHWPPNVDSALYFHREILPLVKVEEPDCTFTIAGQRPVAAVRGLASDPAVRVLDHFDDERQIAADCGVFVVPLRSGSGVRVKILNALAMGLPVVSTSIGAEGIDVVSGEHLLIADNPEEFARAVVTLLRERDLADRLGENGRELVSSQYSWERVGGRLLGLYDRLGAPGGRRSDSAGEDRAR